MQSFFSSNYSDTQTDPEMYRMSEQNPLTTPISISLSLLSLGPFALFWRNDLVPGAWLRHTVRKNPLSPLLPF